MKVTICSCARCTAAGSEFLYDSAHIVQRDLGYAYELEGLGDAPTIEITYDNIMSEVEDPERSAPVAKVDEKIYIKTKPEVLMEHIFDKFTPESEVI